MRFIDKRFYIEINDCNGELFVHLFNRTLLKGLIKL